MNGLLVYRYKGNNNSSWLELPVNTIDYNAMKTVFKGMGERLLMIEEFHRPDPQGGYILIKQWTKDNV